MSIRVGILGATRGLEFARAARRCGVAAEFTAVCDGYAPLLGKVKASLPELGFEPAYYTDYTGMLEETGIDAVIVANSATDHAQMAIAALERGIHVLSEVLPAQTPAQAVALVEAVERSGRHYAYAENYCYFRANLEAAMRFRRGDIGDLVAGEADFINDCSQRWHLLTRGLRGHWRNHVPATFYCTHSLGPLFYATGRRPVRVTGFEIKNQEYLRIHGARNGSAAMEIVELDDGSYFKSLHGNLKRPWVTRLNLFGTRGSIESRNAGEFTVYRENEAATGYNDFDTLPGTFSPVPGVAEAIAQNAEAFILAAFLGAIRGDANLARYSIGIYQALDMALPGMFAHRSVLAGGAPVAIPDFRRQSDRDRYRDDHRCTDPGVAAGEELLPSYSRGEIAIPDEVYEREATLAAEAMEKQFRLGML